MRFVGIIADQRSDWELGRACHSGATAPSALLLFVLLCVCQAAVAQTPPATVGQINGLSVAENITTAEQFGSVFPFVVTAERVGAERAGWASNVQLDAYAQKMVQDAFAYLSNADASGEIVLPEGFLAEYRYTINFTLGGALIAGDSAGCALAIAIFSALTETPILDGVAVTGAIQPDGRVTSVGDIATKMDGVIGAHTGTMILPAENSVTTKADMDAVIRKAFPDIRIVTVSDMHQAMFYALGPYGPEAQRYQTYAADYANGVRLADSGDFEASVRAFEALSKAYPEDNSSSVWIELLQDTQLREYVRLADRALRKEDYTEARRLVLEAYDLYPDSPEVGELLERLSGRATDETPDEPDTPVAPQIGAAGGVLRPGQVTALPQSVDAAAWRAQAPLAVGLAPVVGRGPAIPCAVRALATSTALALLIEYQDPSGSFEQSAGVWRLAAEGFEQVGRDDGLLLVWERGLQSGRKVVMASKDLTSGADLAEEVDAWAWRAGTSGLVDHADDLHITKAGLEGDSGGPTSALNINATGDGPRYVFNGAEGAFERKALDMDSIIELGGDPVAGREAFNAACLRCHGADAPEKQARVTRDIALRPAGSPDELRRQLTQTRHSEIAAGLSVDDLIAYIQICTPTPLVVCGSPTGSRADVRAQANSADGAWRVALQRGLLTGEPDDVPLAPDSEHGFYLVVNDGATGLLFVSERVAIELGARGAEEAP